MNRIVTENMDFQKFFGGRGSFGTGLHFPHKQEDSSSYSGFLESLLLTETPVEEPTTFVEFPIYSLDIKANIPKAKR